MTVIVRPLRLGLALGAGPADERRLDENRARLLHGLSGRDALRLAARRRDGASKDALRMGIDLAGGSDLIFQVDTEKAQQEEKRSPRR